MQWVQTGSTVGKKKVKELEQPVAMLKAIGEDEEYIGRAHEQQPEMGGTKRAVVLRLLSVGFDTNSGGRGQ